MSDRKELESLMDQLAARGVVDVKFSWSPEVRGTRMSKVVRDLIEVLKAVLAKEVAEKGEVVAPISISQILVETMGSGGALDKAIKFFDEGLDKKLRAEIGENLGAELFKLRETFALWLAQLEGKAPAMEERVLNDVTIGEQLGTEPSTSPTALSDHAASIRATECESVQCEVPNLSDPQLRIHTEVTPGVPAIYSISPTVCDCHNETCSCGPYTLSLNGKSLVTGYIEQLESFMPKFDATEDQTKE